MSSQTVYFCDICGKEMASSDRRAFYGSAGGELQPIEFGSCCHSRQIIDLIAVYARLYPPKKPAP